MRSELKLAINSKRDNKTEPFHHWNWSIIVRVREPRCLRNRGFDLNRTLIEHEPPESFAFQFDGNRFARKYFEVLIFSRVQIHDAEITWIISGHLRCIQNTIAGAKGMGKFRWRQSTTWTDEQERLINTRGIVLWKFPAVTGRFLSCAGPLPATTM